MAHCWTPAEDTLIAGIVREQGITLKTFKELKARLGVTRHQLRNRMHTLGLTPYGRRKAMPKEMSSGIVLEAERDKQHLKDQVSILRAQVKEMKRYSALFHALRGELEQCVEPLSVLPRAQAKPTGTATIDEDLVMHLSDEHADQVVLPHRVMGLEEYNLQVTLARAERYVQTVLDFTQHTLTNYRFKTLWILAYGDHVNGEIHDSTDHSSFRNSFQNCLGTGKMHALMIRDLAPHFENVKVLYVAGNHGRRTPKKEYVGGALNNWDYLVGETARLLCKDMKNVEFMIPDSFAAVVNIRGWNFHVSHGDDIKSVMGIPFYGIERKTRRLSTVHNLTGENLDYQVMGHFHSMSTLSQPGCRVIVNGSWKRTDEYSYNAFGGVSEPEQLIHGVHEKHGMSWQLPVRLAFKGDNRGPKRYRVDFPNV